MLTALGAAAGVAVENARLYEEAKAAAELAAGKQRADDLAAVRRGSPAEVLEDLTRQALELSGADLVTLALPDEDGRRLTLEYAAGDGAAEARGLVVPAGKSLSGQVLASGEPHHRGELRRRPAYRRHHQAADGAYRARRPVPARHAWPRARRAHRRALHGQAADTAGGGERRRGVRRAGGGRTRTRRSPGRRGAAVGVRGPRQDRQGPARPGDPAALRHRHVARGHHADDHQARGRRPGAERRGRDGRHDQGHQGDDLRAPVARPGRPRRGCGRTSSRSPRK